MNDATTILSAIEQGDPRAVELLLPLVYDELRNLAARYIAHERPDQTLQATALVHEAYLRLVGEKTQRVFRDHHHFFATAATAMRRILIDRARSRRAKKRGGGGHRVPLGEPSVMPRDEELLALDEALGRLAVLDPIKAQLVELRYFAGLTGEQAAEVLEISPSTADRYWVFARAWLQADVRGE
jgi:RNA polymerase sigma factor (TIGR02999 family)